MLHVVKSYHILVILLSILISCSTNQTKKDKLQHMNKTKTASQILGNAEFQAISYGGYRESSRETQPTNKQLKDDMKILSAMGIKVLRTYNTHYRQAANLLLAISEMRAEDPNFEMFVMLGAWIDCENAWTEIAPNHDAENEEGNAAEIQRAVDLATPPSKP